MAAREPDHLKLGRAADLVEQDLTMYDVRSTFEKAKAMVLNMSEIETKVREATNGEAWGASSTTMQEIAQSYVPPCFQSVSTPC